MLGQDPDGATAPVFRDEAFLSILSHVRRALARGDDEVSFCVLDPDWGRGRFAGELIEVGGRRYRHRPIRAWLDLADRLRLRMSTPRPAEPPLVCLRFERLRQFGPRTPIAGGALEERYGATSPFARIQKLEEPGFVLDFAEALERVALSPHARVLDLGVGRGDELALLEEFVPGFSASGRFVGVDHSATALEVARSRFRSPRSSFFAAPLAELDDLALGTFDLVLSIATFQSPGVDDRELLRSIVQRHLKPTGAVILGLPNCAYLDGEVIAGAKTRNYRQAELGLLVKDLAFYRRYLQQHNRLVYVTGSHEILVTAVPRQRDSGGG